MEERHITTNNLSVKEYKIAKGWGLVIYIGAPLLFGLFAWLLSTSFSQVVTKPFYFWLVAPTSLGMMTVCVLGFIEAIKGRLIITPNSLIQKEVFKTREFKFDEIKGYRETDKFIFIFPSTEGKKKMRVSVYYGKFSVFKEWLFLNFADLDQAEAEKEYEAIISNEELGWTPEERDQKLKQAKKVARIINILGIAIGLWGFFMPSPYRFALIAMVIFPIASVLIIKLYKSLIRVDERKGSPYPTVLWGLMAPSFAIGLRALVDFEIFDYTNLWPYLAIVVVGLLVIVVIGSKEFNFSKLRDYGTLVSIAMIFAFYAYGSVASINCYFDTSKAQVFKAKIVSKRISKGKTTTYYLRLTPWGPRAEEDDVSVTEDLYSDTEEGAEVTVYLQNGQLNIPWYYVTN